MKIKDKEEILCISNGKVIFGIGFSYIIEICSDIRISKMPCMPDHFIGVFHYKGSILPVVRLGESKVTPKEELSEKVILVIQYDKYQVGIAFEGEPGIVSLDEAQKLENPEESVISGIWYIKEMYKQEDRIYSVLDIERTLKELVIFK